MSSQSNILYSEELIQELADTLAREIDDDIIKSLLNVQPMPDNIFRIEEVEDFISESEFKV